MRVMTYNILVGASDRDLGERTDVVGRVVRAAAPDVLGVTEANGFDEPARLAQIESAFGMKGVVVPASTGFHVALFTRPPWRVVAHGREHSPFFHAALWATVAGPNRHGKESTLTAAVAHLNPFSPESRLAEIRALCRHADSRERVVLMGDFNATAPGDEIDPSVRQLPRSILARFIEADCTPDELRLDTRALALCSWAGFHDVYRELNPRKPGWTLMTTRFAAALRSRMRIDYLLATDRLARHAVSADVIETDDSRRASDHYPLIAEFSI